MLGTYRYLLAVMVVLAHLTGWENAGAKAVFGFYLISGYLMTLVLNRTYGFSPRGTARFLLNRALRIYPPYWAVVGLTFVYLLFQPDFPPTFKEEMVYPTTLVDWIKNLLIFGMGHSDPVRWIPPTWSLYAELFFYVAMAFGLARGRAIALIWLVASVGYTGFMIVDGYSFGERYYPIPAASLPFSLGAVAYHYGLQFANTRPMHATLGLAIFAFSGLFSNDLWSDPRLEGFYASLAAAALAQALLLGLSPERVPKAFVRLDSVLGDLAYPIFLAHYLIGSAVACAFAAAGADPWGLIPFAVAFVVMHAVAFGVHQLVERPVATYRDRVREVDAGDAGSRRAVGIEG